MLKIDSYNTYARAFPVYITIAPIVLILFAILPDGFDWHQDRREEKGCKEN